MSHTSNVALKKRSGIRRPLPWVTRERAASVGGSPRWAMISVFCGAGALGAALDCDPDPAAVCEAGVAGAQPAATMTIARDNRVVSLILRTLSSRYRLLRSATRSPASGER